MKTTTNTMGASNGLPRLLRARLGWILLVTLVVMTGAAMYSWSRTPVYRGEAEVLVDPVPISGAAMQVPNMETEKAIASSGVVLAMVSSSLRVGEKELADGLSVTVIADSRILKITYSHPDPREARRRAQALADAFAAYHSGQQLSRPSGNQNTNSADAARTTGSPVTAVRGVVITRATVPSTPASPNHALELAVALLIGLSIGIGSAIVRDRLDDRLRSPDDLEIQAERPVLATIPAFQPTSVEPAGQLVVVRDPESPVAEAYRNLRALLLQTATRRGAKTLLVTTPSGTGTTTVAANLAAAMAQAGRRVVLVCADLRRPRTHQVFGVENQLGLAAVLSGRLSVSKALLATNVEHLLLVPAGYTTDPGAVLLAPSLQSTLDELREVADLVVIDAPPVLAGPDTPVLAEFVEMIVPVADARESTGGQVRCVARQAQVQEKVIGWVLDNVGPRQRPSKPAGAQPYAPHDAATVTSPHENGRFVGRVPSARSENQEALRGSNTLNTPSGN